MRKNNNLGYCEDCKHWDKYTSNNKMGVCRNTINGWESSVGTMSEDGWEGGIYTGPYYGCIHFEKIDAEETWPVIYHYEE